MTTKPEPDLGDFVLVLLAGTLAGLRDHLAKEGFADAAALVGEFADRCDSFVEGMSR